MCFNVWNMSDMLSADIKSLMNMRFCNDPLPVIDNAKKHVNVITPNPPTCTNAMIMICPNGVN